MVTQARLLFLAAVLAAAGCRTTSPAPVLVPLPALPGAEEAVALAEASKDPAMAADLLWVHANRRAEARARRRMGATSGVTTEPSFLSLFRR